MIKNKAVFDRLVAEALAQEFKGWDFSFIDDRWRMQPTTWDYPSRVMERFPAVSRLLDMDTGGGELLASLSPLPQHTYATEAYPPNIPVARQRLEPLGVHVVAMPLDYERILPYPFEPGFFDMVINRHSGYSASEVHRLLKDGGWFITQQVGGQNNIRLNELIQEKVEFEFSYWTLDYALQEIRQAGFQVLDAREEFPETVVTDIGAVVFQLKVISWQIAGFSVERYYDKLVDIHNHIQEQGQLVIHSHRFFIEAVK
jgi:SAM-dependent methyltransferase